MATRVNLCTNPSFETDLDGWTFVSGPATRSSEVGGVAGSYAYRQPGDVFSSAVSARHVISAAGSTTYSASAYFRSATGTITCQLYLDSSPDGSTWTPRGNSSAVAAGSTSWSRVSFVGTATDSGDTLLRLSTFRNTGSNSAAVLFCDAVLIEAVSSVGSYFDGDFPDGAVRYAWTGTAHASTSTAEDLPNGSGAGTLIIAGTALGVAPLPTPTGLTATAISDTEIDLSWSASAGALWYEVERDGVVIARWLTATSYSDTGLTPDTAYSYRVRAVKNHV